MSNDFLYSKLDSLKDAGCLKHVPEIIHSGLSNNIVLREYQKDAFKYFVTYFENERLRKNKQVHNLFHMATGSGKTVIMAGLMLYLYTKGYRKFLFFVNQTNVLEKTIDNFTNYLSNKYLFNEIIEYNGNRINIKKVNNFGRNATLNDIEIIFTTTQKLHLDLFFVKENSITLGDFEDNNIVFISDESHHVNSLTKKASKDEEDAIKSWEYSVTKALQANKNSIMLEFTATCDLKDKNVEDKYKDKIIFNYPLISFRESGYTKDFQNFATDTDLWTRSLIALLMSEYRKFLFSELKLNIKPIIMLKSQKISESEKFYEDFFKRIDLLTNTEIIELKSANIKELNEAVHYFEAKDDSLELLVNSIKNSFTKDTTIIMNGTSDNNREKQLLVNSLEDIDNPIRVVFAVDMLNEGWDVLNLFDIVRLYDTRQGGSVNKIGSYTIKEAQLIGRGARYCPFVDGDEDYKYKRKYDGDLSNKNRILETMYFHSKNDSQYISELKQALIATGLQDRQPITIEYKLKDSFKETELYKNGYVFSNKKLRKSRKDINFIESSIKSKKYYYIVSSGKGSVLNLFDDDKPVNSIDKKYQVIKLKEIDTNILYGAIDFFDELKFSKLKQRYPNLTSTKEFLLSDDFLGNSSIEITYFGNEISGKNILEALKKEVFPSIVSHINSLKTEYIGSREFTAHLIKDVIKDKKIYLSSIDKNGGKGDSQVSTLNEKLQLNLNDKNDWYVYNDNFGTNEEKLFIKYFKTDIEPKLQGKDLEYYVIRNERIPELAIYSFEAGERFEPDFLLFIRKKNNKSNTLTYQTYIEPKGSHLLEQDAWKEKFSLEIEKNHTINFINHYKILGLPFFNGDNIEKFKKSIDDFIKKLQN